MRRHIAIDIGRCEKNIRKETLLPEIIKGSSAFLRDDIGIKFKYCSLWRVLANWTIMIDQEGREPGHARSKLDRVSVPGLRGEDKVSSRTKTANSKRQSVSTLQHI